MKSVQAAAMGQQAPEAPVSFHFSKDPQSSFENTRILTEARDNSKKTIMGVGRFERSSQEDEILADFATEFGSYCHGDWLDIEKSLLPNQAKH